MALEDLYTPITYPGIQVEFRQPGNLRCDGGMPPRPPSPSLSPGYSSVSFYGYTPTVPGPSNFEMRASHTRLQMLSPNERLEIEQARSR